MNFYRSVWKKTVMSYYDKGGHPTLQKMLAVMQNQTGFSGYEADDRYEYKHSNNSLAIDNEN
jgi:hypothetical protein